MVGYMYVYANTGISAEGGGEEKEAKKEKDEEELLWKNLLSSLVVKCFLAFCREGFEAFEGLVYEGADLKSIYYKDYNTLE